MPKAKARKEKNLLSTSDENEEAEEVRHNMISLVLFLTSRIPQEPQDDIIVSHWHKVIFNKSLIWTTSEMNS